ncbi:hypothetical protein ES703_49172 [subsurface metagenome]
MAIPSRWLITSHDTKWVGFDLKIVVQTDVDCHLTMRYQQHGIEPHFRTKMVRGVPQTKDPHLAFDNYLEMDELDAGDHKTHRFKLPFPYVYKTYYWKFVGTIGGAWSPSHSPVFSEHLTEVIEVTKEIYFPIMNFDPLANADAFGDIPVFRSLASNHTCHIPFFVPDNFEELTIAEVVLIVRNTDHQAEWGFTVTFASQGELYNTHKHSDLATTYDCSGQMDQIKKIDITALFADIAIGDFGGVEFLQIHADHDALIMGMRFRYE